MSVKGFLLIEGLVAVYLTFLVALSIGGLLTYFGLYNKKNIDLTCEIMAVTSAIEACRGGILRTSFSCAGKRIAVEFEGHCNPSPGNCQPIQARVGNFKLTDIVCNF